MAKQACELGFKGGFVIIDQAKMDEMAKVIGGYAPLEGAIRVLPLIDDPAPDSKNFVQRFQKSHPGRVPSSEGEGAGAARVQVGAIQAPTNTRSAG